MNNQYLLLKYTTCSCKQHLANWSWRKLQKYFVLFWNYYSILVCLRLVKNLSLCYLSLFQMPYLTDKIGFILRICIANTISVYVNFHIVFRFYLSVSIFYQEIQFVNINNIQVLKKSHSHCRNWYLDYQNIGSYFSQKIIFD